jgi:hypothetical protein
MTDSASSESSKAPSARDRLPSPDRASRACARSASAATVTTIGAAGAARAIVSRIPATVRITRSALAAVIRRTALERDDVRVDAARKMVAPDPDTACLEQKRDRALEAECVARYVGREPAHLYSLVAFAVGRRVIPAVPVAGSVERSGDARSKRRIGEAGELRGTLGFVA